jgi:hypothetical protein
MKGREQAEKHLQLLGILQIAFNVVALVVGIFVFMLLAAIGVASGEPEAMAVLAIVGHVVAFFLVGLSAPGVVAGIGILRKERWARVLGLIVGALELLDVPFGTALGVYTLWVLLDDEVVELFERRQA